MPLPESSSSKNAPGNLRLPGAFFAELDYEDKQERKTSFLIAVNGGRRKINTAVGDCRMANGHLPAPSLSYICVRSFLLSRPRKQTSLSPLKRSDVPRLVAKEAHSLDGCSGGFYV